MKTIGCFASEVCIDSFKIQDKKILLFKESKKVAIKKLKPNENRWGFKYKKALFFLNFDSVIDNPLVSEISKRAIDLYQPSYKAPLMNSIFAVLYNTDGIYCISIMDPANLFSFKAVIDELKFKKLNLYRNEIYYITIIRGKGVFK